MDYEYNKKIILILSSILFVLLIVFLKNTFTIKNMEQINVKYPNKIENTKPLENCYENKNILADYYIASSYNSACIGNQQYDYLSIDMLKKVIKAGARLLDFQIFEKNLYPVIATGIKEGEWITSLNILSVDEVLRTINSFAFYINEKIINYPIFINLRLTTDKTLVLNILYKLLTTTFGSKLVNSDKYQKKSISLEKICNLNNKVIIFCQGNYYNSKLKNIVIPNNGYINRINITNNIIEKDNENTLLSRQQQRESDKEFDKIYQKFTNNTNIMEKLNNNEKIRDKLPYYNKVGLTFVSPHNEDDTTTLNYNFNDNIKSGSQFIMMNYQSLDKYLKDYLKYFKNSSFILKPDSFRLYKIQKENIVDVNKFKYLLDEKKKEYNILTDFNYNYGNKVFSIENNNMCLTISGSENLIFKSKEVKNSKQYFFIENIKDDNYIIRPIHYPQLSISYIDNYYKLTTAYTKFIPIQTKCGIGFLKKDNTQHLNVLGNKNNVLANMIYNDTEIINRKTCFNLEPIVYEKYMSIQFINGEYLTSNKSGNIYLDNDKYFFKIVKSNNNEYILKANNGLLLGSRDNYLVGNITEIMDNVILIINKKSGYFIIKNNNGKFLSYINNKLKFRYDKPLLRDEVLDDEGNIIKMKKYGLELDENKFFRIQYKFNI